MFAMIDVEALVAGQRSAVLLLVTPTDRYRSNQEWQPASELPVGTHVRAVDQPMTQVAPAVGEEILVRSLVTRHIYRFVPTDIHLVRANDLTADELLALGHGNRDSFERSLSGKLGDRLCWFIQVFPAAVSDMRH